MTKYQKAIVKAETLGDIADYIDRQLAWITESLDEEVEADAPAYVVEGRERREEQAAVYRAVLAYLEKQI